MIQTNSELKTQLLSQIEILGKERSLLPFSETHIDETIAALENVNPITRPLSPDDLSSLVGEWQLIYASNGTVVTRPLAEITSFIGSGIKVKKIWQTINNFSGEIIVNNQALIELPLLGEYQIGAEGTWQPKVDEKTATVTFNLFSLQASKFLSQPDWTLPELQVPVLDFLRNEAIWITSYLDEDMRIGRKATGNLFVFRR